MRRMTRRMFESKLKAITERIKVQRDSLRDLIDEAEGLRETCDRALDDLESAADTLSELV